MSLARRKLWGAGWGQTVPVCVSTPQFIQLGGLSLGRFRCMWQICTIPGLPQVGCTHVVSGCHTLPQGTLLWSKDLFLVPAGQLCQLFLTSEVKKENQSLF